MANLSRWLGADSLGSFELNAMTKCGVCGKGQMGLGRSRDKGKPRITCIIYHNKPKVDAYTAKAKSLLIRNKKTGNFIRTVGINCGCYAKVHRQIAHISSGRSTR